MLSDNMIIYIWKPDTLKRWMEAHKHLSRFFYAESELFRSSLSLAAEEKEYISFLFSGNTAHALGSVIWAAVS